MQTHTVHTGDSLTAIASRYYGDATRWRAIVTANNLRPPYISTDPLAAYGDLQATTPLAAEAATGSRVLLIDQGALVRPNSQIVVILTSSDGTEAIITTAASQVDTGAITLADALPQTVRAGTPILIFPPASEVRGSVAMPGSVLRIPEDGDTTTVDTDPTITSNRYLRDIATVDGRITITNGDLVIAAGLPNLQQQLTNRMRSERGTLYRHPTYGNDAYTYIGQANGPTLALLVQAALAQCVAADLRVAEVTRVDATAVGEIVTATVAVRAEQDSTTLALTITR